MFTVSKLEIKKRKIQVPHPVYYIHLNITDYILATKSVKSNALTGMNGQ